jgi:alkyl sulfatase BDS1-like metallo-beta-lactamase superfamily hydrolase
MIRAMSTELFLDFIGIRMDSRKAEGMQWKINLVTPDNGEKFVVEMSNATLTNIQGYQAEDAEFSVTINRADLEPVMMGTTTLAAQIDAGKAQISGDRGVLDQLRSTLVTFDLGFEIMPGTKGPGKPPEQNPFEQGPIELRGE